MTEVEGGHKPPEADIKSQPENKGSFRDVFKKIVKNWPSRMAVYRRLEKMSERVHQKREQDGSETGGTLEGINWATMRIVDNFKGLEELNTARNELADYGKGVTEDSEKYKALEDFSKIYEQRENTGRIELLLEKESSSDKRLIIINELNAESAALSKLWKQIVEKRIPGSEYANESEEWEKRIRKFEQVFIDRQEYAVRSHQVPRVTTSFDITSRPNTAVRIQLDDIKNAIK